MHGVLVVDKPAGPTSHDVVARARRLYGTRAVGHAGTLDPMASGVLLLLLGEACKLSQYLTALSKRYRAEVSFGTSTDTLDATGQVIEERTLPPGWLEPDQLEHALEAERGRTLQVPPAVSAIQVGGERAYRAARSGRPVALPERPVSVAELVLSSSIDQRITLELEVSKGYYVRALARDLGARLGVPAHLSALRRLSSGAFGLDEAVAWPSERPPPLLSLAEAARRVLRCVCLSDEGVVRARAGRALHPEQFEGELPGDGVCAWLDGRGELVALGQRDPSGELRVVRGFATPQA